MTNIHNDERDRHDCRRCGGNHEYQTGPNRCICDVLDRIPESTLFELMNKIKEAKRAQEEKLKRLKQENLDRLYRDFRNLSEADQNELIIRMRNALLG